MDKRILNKNVVALMKGDKGDAGTIQVGEVETLPAGSEATIENVGTPDTAVLNFGIPKGDKGDTGDGLEIKKWYDSTSEMNSDYSNPNIAVGDTVAINNTLDIYVKGNTAFEYKGSLKGQTGDSGVDDVTAGTPTQSDGYTLTPVTFNFENGNSKTVNVQAKSGADGHNGIGLCSKIYTTFSNIDPSLGASFSNNFSYSEFNLESGDLKVGDKVNIVCESTAFPENAPQEPNVLWFTQWTVSEIDVMMADLTFGFKGSYTGVTGDNASAYRLTGEKGAQGAQGVGISSVALEEI